MSRFNCTDCCLNDTESCRYGANKSKDYSECCPDLLVEQNVAYEKALNDLSELMYQKLFRESSEMQKWDSGCWIRYKLFENCVEQLKKGAENDT